MLKMTCSCGKRLSFDESMAGRSGRCPRCDGEIHIPGVSPPVSAGPPGSAGPTAPTVSAGPRARLTLIKGDEVFLEDREQLDELRRLLEEAIAAGASDIHLEPQSEQLRVRLRVDGILSERTGLPLARGQAMIRQLKVLAELDIAERRMPQDGSFSGAQGDQSFDFRVATLPMVGGEKLVLRLLDKRFKLLDMVQLGMDESQQAALRGLLAAPQGLIAVCGPSGGGKTTTLYSALRTVDATRRNVVTIEDPVEYQLPDVGQVAVNARVGLSFERALRATLRQDADVIMVGEIRDGETARTAFEAALSAHLVLTTLHSQDVVGAITRLADLEVAPLLIAQGLSALISQRLARRLCVACRRAQPCDPALCAQYGLDPELHATLWRPVGCAACGNGYRGRVGLYEMVVLDDPLREVVRRGQASGELRGALDRRGVATMRADGFRKAAAGLTTLEEVIRVAG